MIDSALQLLISLLFSFLLLAASLHKFSDRLRFRGILAAYRIMPVALIAVASSAIPLLELILGLSWLSGTEISLVVIATACLLSIYGMAIAINIVRGNVHIDCGCSFASDGKDDSYQQLSWWLVFRNFILVVLALTALTPVNSRELGMLDYSLLGLACVAIVLVYGAFNQLLANRAIIVGSNHGGSLHG